MQPIKPTILAVLLLLSFSAQASVIYKFIIFDATLHNNVHKPFLAEIVLSDTAVQAGTATNNEIESIQVIGGTAKSDMSPFTIADLHPQFSNLSVTLSEDRKVITDISALVNNASTTHYWLLPFQQSGVNPTSTELYLYKDQIRFASWFSGVPGGEENQPSLFKGQWERACDCPSPRIIWKYFYYYPWPWIMIGMIVVGGVIWRIRRRG